MKLVEIHTDRSKLNDIKGSPLDIFHLIFMLWVRGFPDDQTCIVCVNDFHEILAKCVNKISGIFIFTQ